MTKSVRASGVARRILDGITLHLNAGEFIGILGASGSGKSTLVKALAGLTTLTEGSIQLNGQRTAASDLRQNRRIAYLPQDIIVHEPLTPNLALGYVAQLKGLVTIGRDASDLLQVAMARVGIADRADTPIYRLSGGQRKRVALAAELLGDPQLILLDEATSGLDPATEAGMMDLFRSLADDGRTVVCVTHFPGRLHLCDRLICLHEGICIFDGSPPSLMAFFGVKNIEDVFSRMGESSATEWRRQFDDSHPGIPVPRSLPPMLAHIPPGASTSVSFTDQVIILTRRYARLQCADFRGLGLQMIQAPVIGLMIAFSFGDIRSSFAEQAAADAKLVLFVLTLAVMWCSGTASAREVVKELPVVRHELRYGVDLAAYLTSKVLWLGSQAILQAAVLLFVVRHFTWLVGPPDLQLVILAPVGFVGVALGLCISTVSGTSERAMTVLPVALIGQAIFSGGLARLVGLPLWVAWIASPAFWSLDGLKAPLPSSLKNATFPGSPGTYQPPILGPGGPILVDVFVLLLQAAALLLVAFVALRFTITRFTR